MNAEKITASIIDSASPHCHLGAGGNRTQRFRFAGSHSEQAYSSSCHHWNPRDDLEDDFPPQKIAKRKEVKRMKHPVRCPKCKGSGQIPRKDLPPLLKGAMGIRQTEECPICDGTGYVEG